MLTAEPRGRFEQLCAFNLPAFSLGEIPRCCITPRILHKSSICIRSNKFSLTRWNQRQEIQHDMQQQIGAYDGHIRTTRPTVLAQKTEWWSAHSFRAKQNNKTGAASWLAGSGKMTHVWGQIGAARMCARHACTLGTTLIKVQNCRLLLYAAVYRLTAPLSTIAHRPTCLITNKKYSRLYLSVGLYTRPIGCAN